MSDNDAMSRLNQMGAQQYQDLVRTAAGRSDWVRDVAPTLSPRTERDIDRATRSREYTAEMVKRRAGR